MEESKGYASMKENIDKIDSCITLKLLVTQVAQNAQTTAESGQFKVPSVS